MKIISWNVNGKFSEKQVVNEISIKDKYKDEDCSNVE